MALLMATTESAVAVGAIVDLLYSDFKQNL
ncbi:MAG: hypothetical protein JWR21_3261 [Herminiimonas sp.]|nr:hypothetical protein [Herminiimonas sp.]